MNVLARSTKASYQPITETSSEPSTPPRQAPEQVTSTPSRGHVGPSLIGAGLTIIGKLECAGDIQIEGNIEGEVRGQGVRIGNGAVVKGAVLGEIVQLAGTIEGNIDAHSVILAKSARVTGDICYQSLQIEEGAYFSGHSKPRRKEPARPAVVEVSDDAAAKGCYVTPSRDPAEKISEVA